MVVKLLGALLVQQRPVLMLALEDGHRRLQQRGRVLMDGKPLPDGFDYVTRLGESNGHRDHPGVAAAAATRLP